MRVRGLRSPRANPKCGPTGARPNCGENTRPLSCPRPCLSPTGCPRSHRSRYILERCIHVPPARARAATTISIVRWGAADDRRDLTVVQTRVELYLRPRPGASGRCGAMCACETGASARPANLHLVADSHFDAKVAELFRDLRLSTRRAQVVSRRTSTRAAQA
eukprot:7377161-Prymnesium_polylepis.2